KADQPRFEADIADGSLQNSVKASHGNVRLRSDVGVLASEGHRAAELADQPAAVRVIVVDDVAIRLREENPLRLKVVFEVLVKIEVILREVGEDGRLESHAVRP